MPRPDEVSYNSLITACAKDGHLDSAEYWINKMYDAGLRPDEVSYHSVMDAWEHRGRMDKFGYWLQQKIFSSLIRG